MPKKWIGEAFSKHKKGALHRQLDIPQDERIPTYKLEKIVKTEIGKHAYGKKVTVLLKRRANLALNARK
jgi:hypothetical protein